MYLNMLMENLLTTYKLEMWLNGYNLLTIWILVENLHIFSNLVTTNI